MPRPRRKPAPPKPAAAWQLQDAKARFSELFRQARQEGPQWVTRHGREAVVVLAEEEYRRLQGAPQPNLWDFLRSSPLFDSGLDLDRPREFDDRPLDL